MIRFSWLFLLGVFSVGCGNFGRTDASVEPPLDGGPVVNPADAGPSLWDPVLGNAYEGPIDLSDARVEAVDPATLPAGNSPCRAPLLARVTRIFDGDTVFVTGVSEPISGRVRLIGVDTPEVSTPSGVPECYALEATDFTAALQSRLVWLTFDAGCFDPFDRYLAYVYVGGGERDLWQRQLLQRGYARVLSIAPNTSMAPTFSSDELAAKVAVRGLWASCP